MSFDIDRHRYAELFGPTEGDSIRLGDTDLFIKIEKDYTGYGNECKFGGGKTLRDGMGQNATQTSKNPQLADLIITGATIVDYTGIYKADVGIKDGKILAIGKGGNPDTMDNVDFIVGVGTEALAGEGRILTAGGIDTHVHYIHPGCAEVALENGITTLVGGGTGPIDGTNAVTSTPGPWNIKKMLQSAEGWPVNVGLLGKGSGANIDVNAEQIEAGAIGLKVHEDWGATRSAINYALETAENLDMLMVCHHLDAKVPEDIAFADSRIRHQTIAAEDVFQDMGIFSIMSSDTLAMGRIGEVVTRTWQTASKMKVQRGPLENDSEYNDNNRVKRYIAKYTINPAIAQGMSKYIGSVEVGKIADLVLWEPPYFGVKPHLIIKGGMAMRGIIGDANASIPTCQPVIYRDCYGAFGKAKGATCITFVSKYAYEHGIKEELGLQKMVLPVEGIRNLTKKDMKLNDATPEIRVDPQTYDVTVDGELITCEPASELPLAQRYFLF